MDLTWSLYSDSPYKFENHFHDDLKLLSEAMYAVCAMRAGQSRGKTREAFGKAAMYFAVPVQLLGQVSLRPAVLELQEEVERIRSLHGRSSAETVQPRGKGDERKQEPYIDQRRLNEEHGAALGVVRRFVDSLPRPGGG